MLTHGNGSYGAKPSKMPYNTRTYFSRKFDTYIKSPLEGHLAQLLLQTTRWKRGVFRKS
jgi:hypothetical protein